RDPTVGKSGWSSVCRVTPSVSWLCTPGGSPKSDVSSTSLNSSYCVREIPYPTKILERREFGHGRPNRVSAPIRFRRPVENWKKRSRELNSDNDPDTWLWRSAGSE